MTIKKGDKVRTLSPLN